MKRLQLRLPVPPSKNRIPSGWDGIHMRRQAMLAAWAAACEMRAPTTSPPSFVRARAHFYVGGEWDAGNLVHALYHIVFDALALPVRKSPPSWRQGLHEWKGFIVDDSSSHLELVGMPEHTIVDDPRHRRLELELEWEEPAP